MNSGLIICHRLEVWMRVFIDMHREDAVKEWSINKVEVRNLMFAR